MKIFIFYDDCLEIKEIKGGKAKLFHGYLSYTSEYCHNCGYIMKVLMIL